jgi:surface antigen
MRQNLLLTANDLKIGDTIIIPGAEKYIPEPVVVPTKTYAAAKTTTSTYKAPATTAVAQSEYVNAGGQYNLVWRSPYSGVWGNCTWYVASYKNVNWRGNANRWMANAKAAGNAIGYNPSIGAIVQFEGRGYNPYYGHVGIVIDMTSTHIIVSDMNYRALGEVTTRKVPINDRTIK